MKRTAERLYLREDARRISSAACIGFGLASATTALVLRTGVPPVVPLASIGAIALLLPGINRLMGTLTIVDVEAGTITVSRTVGRVCLVSRRFAMDDVCRVFHDARPYLRLAIQNPKLQLLSGRQINLAQWCPSEADLEAEVAAANRLLHAWKSRQALARGERIQSYPAMYSQAAPRAWTLDGLRTLNAGQRPRNLRLGKRTATALVLSAALLFGVGPLLPAPIHFVLGVAFTVFLSLTLIFGVLLALDRWLERSSG